MYALYDDAVKQKYREKEAQSRISAEAKNQFNKRPLGITPATSTSPTAPNTRSYPAAGTSSSLRNATTSVGALQALTMGESSSNAVVAGQAGDSSTTAAGSGGKGKVRLGRDGFPVEDDPNKVSVSNVWTRTVLTWRVSRNNSHYRTDWANTWNTIYQP